MAVLVDAQLTDGATARGGPARAGRRRRRDVWSLLRADGDGAAAASGRARTGWSRSSGSGRPGSAIAVGARGRRASARLLARRRAPGALGRRRRRAGYRWADVGLAREHVAARLLRDVAPHVSDGARTARPDVVVLVEDGVADPVRGTAPWSPTATAHLSVVVREADALVGPLVRARAPARACAASTCTAPTPTPRGRRSPRSSRAGGDRRRARGDVARASAPALAAAQVLAHLDGASRPRCRASRSRSRCRTRCPADARGRCTPSAGAPPCPASLVGRAGRRPPGPARQAAGASFLRGRPRPRLRATTTPPMNTSPPQTPHGSGALDGTGEAALDQRALAAQRLGLLDLGGPLGEPELGVVRAARDEVGDELVERLAVVGRRGAVGEGPRAGSALVHRVEQRREPHDVLLMSLLVSVLRRCRTDCQPVHPTHREKQKGRGSELDSAA